MAVVSNLRYITIKLISVRLTACVNACKERREEQSGLKIRDLGAGVLPFE
jgi:hypothetical protein